MISFNIIKRLFSFISTAIVLFIVAFTLFAYLAVAPSAVAQQNDDDDDDRTSAFGVVRFPDERPVPNVWVEIRTKRKPPQSTVLSTQLPFNASMLTNQKGEFKFSNLPQQSDVDYEIQFRLPRSLFEFLPPKRVVFTEPVKGDLGSFSLRKANNNTDLPKQIKGKVESKDSSGDASLGELKIQAIELGGQRKLETKTNQSGEFGFFVSGGQWLVKGASNQLWFFEKDEKKVIEFAKSNEQETKTLTLTVKKVGGSGFFKVFGRIVTPDKQPLPADSVEIELCNEKGECFDDDVAAGGQFEVRVKPGSYEVEISIENDELPYLAPYLKNRINVRDRDKDMGELKLRSGQDRTAQLTGQVLLTPTNRGVASVTLKVVTLGKNSGDRNATTTDKQGDFSLNFLPGKWSASIDLTPEQKERYLVQPPHRQYGRTTKGQTATVTFYLKAIDATIYGTMVDDTGAVLTETEGFVVAELCSDKSDASTKKAASGCQLVNKSGIFDGRFQLRVASGYTYYLRSSVDTDAHQAASHVKVAIPTGATTATATLALRSANQKIFGNLYDVAAKKNVKAKAIVTAYGKNGVYIEKRIDDDDDDGGSYELHVPANTTWRVSYSLKPQSGYVAATSTFSSVVTVKSEDVKLNLPVQALSQGYAIQGKVVDESGKGIANTTVFAKGVKKSSSNNDDDDDDDNSDDNDDDNNDDNNDNDDDNNDDNDDDNNDDNNDNDDDNNDDNDDDDNDDDNNNRSKDDDDDDDDDGDKLDLKRVFETKTDETGAFTLAVAPGAYQVGAYVPAALRKVGYTAPKPVRWGGTKDNPLTLTLRKRSVTTGGLTISGSLSGEGLAADAKIDIYAVSNDKNRRFTTGTVADGYKLPVFSDTTWFIWAVYENRANRTIYKSAELSATVGSESLTGVDIALTKATFKLPDSKCLDFDVATATRFQLPGRSDLLPPLLEIQANTIPADGTVTICAEPLASVEDGQDMLGFGYELSVRNSNGKLISQNFDQDMRVIVYFTTKALAGLPGGADSLQIGFYDEDRDDWVALDDLFVDEDDGFVTGKISHFSAFGARSVTNKSGTTATRSNIYLPIVVKQ